MSQNANKKSLKKNNTFQVFSTNRYYNNENKINKRLRNTDNINEKPLKNGHIYEDRIDIYIDKDKKLFGLYDGHGMGPNAKTNYIVDYVKENLLKRIANFGTINEYILNECFKQIETECFNNFSKKYPYMGCTATVVCIQNNKIIVAWVGDSPCYGIRRNCNIVKLIDEHDYDNENERKRIGINNWQDKRVGGTIMMSRSLGDFEEKNRSRLSWIPEIKTYNLNSFDKILLCSDGVSDALSEEFTMRYNNIDIKKFQKDINIKSNLRKIICQQNLNCVIPRLVSLVNTFISRGKPVMENGKIVIVNSSITSYRDDISAIFIKL